MQRRRDHSGTGSEQRCALTERRLTDRRRQPFDYRHREFRLRAAAQAGGAGIYDLDYATGSNYWSAELKALAGLPAEPGDVPLEQLVQLIHPDDRDRVLDSIQASLDPQGNGHFAEEYRLVRPEGTIRWVKVRGQTFFMDTEHGRRVLGASGIVVDITDRLEAEKRLREQAEELRLALRVSNSGTFQWDARTHEHRWCDEMLALYGIERKEFGGRDEDWLACLLPEDREPTLAAVERSLQTGEYAATFRIRRRDDGEVRWVNGRGQVFFAADGTPLRMVGINVDISAQKQAEARLQESEARFRHMADAAPALIWMTGTGPGCTWFNQPWLAFSGRTLEQELGTGWTERLHPEAAAPARQVFEAAFERREPFSMEYRLRRHDGEYRWLLNQGVPRFEGEMFAGYIGSAIDITDYKEAQAKLTETSNRLIAILDSLSEGVVIFDLKGQVLNTNPAARRIMRYITPEDALRRLPDFRETFEVLSMEGRPLPLEEWPIGKVMGGQSFSDYEILLRRKDDGSSQVISHNGTRVRNGGDTPLGVLTLRDVTQSQAAARALKDSEQRLAVALQASGSAVWEMDVADGIVRGEPLLFTMLGYAPGELTTLAEWHALVHEDDREAIAGQFDGMMAGKQDLCRFEVRVRAKDGAWRWILSQAAPVERDADGRAVHLVGTHTDIHGRKEMEEALHRESSRLQSILDNAPVLIWIRDWQGRVVVANRALLEALELPPLGEIIGQSIFSLFPKEEAQRIWANDQQALEMQAPIRTEKIWRHRDGSEHAYLTIIFPVLDVQTGQPRSMCSIAVEITDRKAMESRIQALNADLERRVQERTTQLQQANDGLLQANMDLKHFAHATAHDLQTPLRSIAGFTQLLQQEVAGYGNERVEEWSSLVVENTKRLQRLIQELLSYTGLEVQGRPFEMVSLQFLVDEVLGSLSPLVGEREAEVTCADLPTLAVDRIQIAQVIQNLIENGIKYNQSKPPRIVISAELQENEWIFSVADNGIGIDPKHHEKIFEIFRRLHAYHQIPGTGVGLALCRRIIERHGGHIWVESRLGEGSTFYFSLPVRRGGT